MGKKNKSHCIDISCEYEVEEDGFIDNFLGDAIKAFDFSKDKDDIVDNSYSSIPSTIIEPQNDLYNIRGTTTEIKDNRSGKPCANGITPPIDGEVFDIRRTYILRKSTLRKLNEIKAHHSNVNIYLNTIIDEAIVFYHNHVFSKKL